MDNWTDVIQWAVAMLGIGAVLAALVTAGMAWLLNHPD